MEEKGQASESVSGRELAEQMRAYARAVQRVNVAMAHVLDMPPTDVWALEHLFTAGPLGPVELGHRLGIRSASATALVDRLEQAGHVERRPHAVDRRRLVVVPTDDAETALLETFLPLFSRLDEAAADLTPDERAAVARYLERVTAILESYSAEHER